MRIFLIDEDFRDCAGHHAAYDVPICLELRRRSIETQIFGHFQAGWSERYIVPLLPTFTKTRWSYALPAKLLPHEVFRCLTAGIGNIFTVIDLITRVTPRIMSNDIVVMCRPNSQTRLAYSLWSFLLCLRRITLTQVYIFHNSPHKGFKWEAALLNVCAKGHRIIYVAHTEPLANLCRKLTRKPCYLVPLPLGAAGSADDSSVVRGRESVSFVYLGMAHYNKGVDTLIDAIDALRDMVHNGSIRFWIQCYMTPESRPSARLRDALISCAQRTAGISLVMRPLASDEYMKALTDGDVVVIPHRRESYGSALSGVFTEALSMGKPVIVSAGTYMGEQMRLHGAGITFESGNGASLAEAIRAASNKIDELRKRALDAKGAWVEMHNARRFVDALIKAIECVH